MVTYEDNEHTTNAAIRKAIRAAKDVRVQVEIGDSYIVCRVSKTQALKALAPTPPSGHWTQADADADEAQEHYRAVPHTDEYGTLWIG
jgi:hypothetical protein